MRRCPAVHPEAERSAFAGFRFPPEVITVAVGWYLRYGLSARRLRLSPDLRCRPGCATRPRTRGRPRGGWLLGTLDRFCSDRSRMKKNSSAYAAGSLERNAHAAQP